MFKLAARESNNEVSDLLIRHLHISHNAPYLPPKSLHKYCFQILLGRLQYPGEMKKKRSCKILGGEARCIMGDVQVACKRVWQ